MGTPEGGKRTAITNKAKYGENYYREIALLSQAAWAENGRKPRGFASNKERARAAGAIGGHISKRRPRATMNVE
jgi:hypothetical protein